MGRGLEGVYQGVMELLEEKRANFPRFYFLSNNEMVDVLVRCGGERREGGHGQGRGREGGALQLHSRTASTHHS